MSFPASGVGGGETAASSQLIASVVKGVGEASKLLAPQAGEKLAQSILDPGKTAQSGSSAQLAASQEMNVRGIGADRNEVVPMMQDSVGAQGARNQGNLFSAQGNAFVRTRPDSIAKKSESAARAKTQYVRKILTDLEGALDDYYVGERAPRRRAARRRRIIARRNLNRDLRGIKNRSSGVVAIVRKPAENQGL
jgi:hypothetical protein